MNDEQLEFFQALLNDLKQQTMAHIEEMKAESSIITHKESNDTFCAWEFLSEYLSENLSVRLTRRTLVFWQEWTECVSAFYHFTLKAESYPFWQQYRTSS